MDIQVNENVKKIAQAIVSSERLDKERKIAALENYSKGVYTNLEALMLSQFHITSSPLKLFFLSKSHLLLLSESLSNKTRAAFICKSGKSENLTEEQRFQRALNFDKAEKATVVKAAFFLPEEDSSRLQVMWVDPMLMKISLGKEHKEIDRMLYQTEELERKTWVRKTRKIVLTDLPLVT